MKERLNRIGSWNVLLLLTGWAADTALLTWLLIAREWNWALLPLTAWPLLLWFLYSLYRRNVRKVAFMFDAIDNADYAFKYATDHGSQDDRLVNESLNRIAHILLQERRDAQQREKYYEMIIDSVDTGIVVIDEKGNIFQTNREARRLLGVELLTHVSQLRMVDEEVEQVMMNLKAGEKQQISFTNERGTLHLSIRGSRTLLKGKQVRILALNDINSELEEKELDSWIRLIRVLTHEIMNSVTPITSLSDTLLSRPNELQPEVQQGLEAISSTGKGLLDFVENYRRFTHIPTPQPSLFYVKAFAERMRQMAMPFCATTHTAIELRIEPEDLIVYADEGLIGRVVSNLLKNAIEAIGPTQPDGRIELHAWCDERETVYIELSNNGPLIPPEEVEHIFVPFFTTKEGGSGIGLSLARQIMRMSGGALTLQSDAERGLTRFILKFP